MNCGMREHTIQEAAKSLEETREAACLESWREQSRGSRLQSREKTCPFRDPIPVWL